ncbi:hypothetical protein BJ742DRAFT_826067 [Cladochytrium replicatum]|nr:hypothetical protein BJ742DRAFT_826067 [Cladochytrium replicatum]
MSGTDSATSEPAVLKTTSLSDEEIPPPPLPRRSTPAESAASATPATTSPPRTTSSTDVRVSPVAATNSSSLADWKLALRVERELVIQDKLSETATSGTATIAPGYASSAYSSGGVGGAGGGLGVGDTTRKITDSAKRILGKLVARGGGGERADMADYDRYMDSVYATSEREYAAMVAAEGLETGRELLDEDGKVITALEGQELDDDGWQKFDPSQLQEVDPKLAKAKEKARFGGLQRARRVIVEDEDEDEVPLRRTRKAERAEESDEDDVEVAIALSKDDAKKIVAGKPGWSAAEEEEIEAAIRAADESEWRRMEEEREQREIEQAIRAVQEVEEKERRGKEPAT